MGEFELAVTEAAKMIRLSCLPRRTPPSHVRVDNLSLELSPILATWVGKFIKLIGWGAPPWVDRRRNSTLRYDVSSQASMLHGRKGRP